MKKVALFLLLVGATLLVGCSPVRITGQVGFVQTRVDGRLALADNSGSGGGGAAAVEQGIGTAFGLGTAQGSPFLRAEADFGAPVVSASALWVRDSGAGRLDSSFGGLPAGTQVVADLDLAITKLTAVYEFDLGPLQLAPGLIGDVLALKFNATEPLFGNREEIDDVVFVPMPALRAATDIGPFRATAEVGYLQTPSKRTTHGRFVDAEALLQWSPLEFGHLFAGYRYIDIDGKGESDNQPFAVSLQISGWIVGGGVRF